MIDHRARNMSEKIYWVYILKCINNTYYTGYTHDLDKRYKSHLNGTGKCKYTRSFKPIYIAQSWEIHASKSVAMKIELHIKKLTHAKKKQIIKNPSLITNIIQQHILESVKNCQSPGQLPI